MIVQKLRLQRGWSQQQLAEFAGLSTRTVQRIENGQAASMETLKSLAAVFEVDFILLQDSLQADSTPESPAMTAAPSPSAHTAPNAAQRTERAERDAFRHVRALRGFYAHATKFAIVIPVLALINALQGPHAPWWVLWVILGWGLGLAFHAVRVLARDHFLGPQWEKRQVERRLGRTLDDLPPQ